MYAFRVIERCGAKKFMEHARVAYEKKEYLDSRLDAQSVIDHLQACISKYNYATKEDLADALGVTSTFDDCRYGWYNIDKAKVITVGNNKYEVRLPDTQRI